MPKVLCPRIECKYNKNSTCKAKEVKMRSWHIHTVHQGFKRMEECMTYEESEKYKKIQSLFKQVLMKK